MYKFKRVAVLVLLTASLFTTGCDVSKIMEVVTKVADAIGKAIPKVKEVIDTVTNALPKNTDTASATANVANEQAAANNANVTITNAGDQEDLTNTNTTTTTINPGNTTAGVGSLPSLTRPNGRAEIERVFGARGTNQTTVSMAAGPNGATRSVTCHSLVAPRLKAVFDEIKAQGLSHLINTYDGCFVNRNKRGGTNPSIHAWGIGIDINASENPMGSSSMTAGQRQLAAIFQKYGFYQLPNDPMHFQYCTGY